ncbi:MAG TPA: hypothetical protein VKF37_02385 [Chloroflexota bacterium]|nr:hypothetical protein [Chloroflexota bacterium]
MRDSRTTTLNREDNLLGGCVGLLVKEQATVDTFGVVEGVWAVVALRRKATGSCKGKGGSMHIADVDQGMLGANGIGTLAVAIGQIAAVSTGDGPVTIAGQSQQSIGDVKAVHLRREADVHGLLSRVLFVTLLVELHRLLVVYLGWQRRARRGRGAPRRARAAGDHLVGQEAGRGDVLRIGCRHQGRGSIASCAGLGR